MIFFNTKNMSFANAQKFNKEKFIRWTGIKNPTFDKMIQILKEANEIKKRKGGRNNKALILW